MIRRVLSIEILTIFLIIVGLSIGAILISGEVTPKTKPYLQYGKYVCPYCDKVLDKDAICPQCRTIWYDKVENPLDK